MSTGGGELKARKVLVLMKGFLGDAVMCEPLLSGLAAAGLDVTAAGPKHVHEVLKHLSGQVKFVEAGKGKGFFEVFGRARKLRTMHFDTVLLVNRSYRSAILGFLAGIPNRIGHKTEGRSPFLTKAIKYSTTAFEAESYADLAQEIGVTLPRTKPHLEVTEAEREWAKNRIGDAALAIQPGARWGYKTVPTSLLQAAAEGAAAQGIKIVFVGGPEERPAADALQQILSEPALNLVGECTLRETMAVLSMVRTALGGDTGIMHIAAALGTPTIAVFASTPIDKWGHHYPPHTPIQAPDQDFSKLDPQVLLERLRCSLS